MTKCFFIFHRWELAHIWGPSIGMEETWFMSLGYECTRCGDRRLKEIKSTVCSRPAVKAIKWVMEAKPQPHFGS